MDTCWYCGEEIEFRWIDGGPKPIHVSGGWCTGYPYGDSPEVVRRETYVSAPVARASAGWATGHARSDLGVPITHPTRCPVCGAEIFFHTNGNGDVVFFDELGWPWPKHECLSTDSGIRTASRDRSLMAVVDLVAPPSRIAPVPGVVVREYDPKVAGRALRGVVLSCKERQVWVERAGSYLRERINVIAVALQSAPGIVHRVHVPATAVLHPGELIEVVPHEVFLGARPALSATSVSSVSPPSDVWRQTSSSSSGPSVAPGRCCSGRHPFDSRAVPEAWRPQDLRCLIIGESPGDTDSAYFYDPIPVGRTDPIEVRRYLLSGLWSAGLLSAPTLEALRSAGFLFDHAIRCQLPRDVIKRERAAAARWKSERAHRASHLVALVNAAAKVWVMGRIALDAVRHVCGLSALIATCRVHPPYIVSNTGEPPFFVSRYMNRWAEQTRPEIIDEFKRFLAG